MHANRLVVSRLKSAAFDYQSVKLKWCQTQEIKFYSLKGADTTFFEYETINFGGIGYDSILHVRFFPKTDVAYMRLNNVDIDTLNISFNTFNTKCCGTITEITNFRFNNRTDIPGSEGTQEIKK